jgi:hypothetical protein
MPSEQLIDLTIQINGALRAGHHVIPAVLAALFFLSWGRQQPSPRALAACLVVICYGLTGVASFVTYLATLLVMRVLFLTPALWIVFGIDALTLLLSFVGSAWVVRRVVRDYWPLVTSSNPTLERDAPQAARPSP